MLTNLPAKDVADLVTTVLLAYHMRQLDKIDNMIQSMGSVEGLDAKWSHLLTEPDDQGEAIHEFVEQVMNQLEARG